MVFPWQDYYRFAKWLEDQSPTSYSNEALYRNVISRAYYSALHATNEFYRDMCNDYPIKEPDETTHKALISSIKKNILRIYKDDEELSEWLDDVVDCLDDFRKLRNMADYKDQPLTPMDKAAVNNAFDTAYSVLISIRDIKRKYLS